MDCVREPKNWDEGLSLSLTSLLFNRTQWENKTEKYNKKKKREML